MTGGREEANKYSMKEKNDHSPKGDAPILILSKCESKKLYCKECKEFHTLQSMVEHSERKHNFSLLATIEDLKKSLAEKAIKEAQQYAQAREIIKEEKNRLNRQAAKLRNYNKLDEDYRRVKSLILAKLNKAKNAKGETSSKLQRMVMQLAQQELKLEKQYYKVTQEAKDISEGNAEAVEKWTKEKNKGPEIVLDYEKLLKEAKSISLMAAAHNEEILEFDQEAKELEKAFMKSIKKHIKEAIFGYNDKYYNKLIDERTKKLQQYRDQARQILAEINELKAKATLMKTAQDKSKKELDEVTTQIAEGKIYLKGLNLTKYKEDVEKLSKTIKDYRNVAKDLQAEQGKTKNELIPLAKNILEGKGYIKKMGLKQLKEEEKELQAKVGKLKIEATQIKGAQDKATNEIKQIVKDIVEGKEYLKQINMHLYKYQAASLSKALEEQKQCVQGAKAKAETIKKEASKLSACLNGIKKEEDAQKWRLEGIKKGIEVKQQALASLDKTIQKRNDEIAKAAKKLAALEEAKNSPPAKEEVKCISCEKCASCKSGKNCPCCGILACDECTRVCNECKKTCCRDCFNFFVCCDGGKLSVGSPTIYGICKPFEELKKLSYVDLSKKEPLKVEDSGIKVQKSCAVFQLQNRAFVIGGDDDVDNYGINNQSLIGNNKVSEFIEADKKLKPIALMKTKRCNFPIARISSTSFCVIGGCTGEKTYTAECELYDINKGKWEDFATLTEAKSWVGCLLFERKTLYCFGGGGGNNR